MNLIKPKKILRKPESTSMETWKESFDEYRYIAPFYNWIIEPFLKPLKKTIARYCQKENLSCIVDICCGTGTQCHLLKEKKITCIGIDISSPMLRTARNSGAFFRYIRMNANRLAFKDSVFEGAVISFALHEKSFESRQTILNEAKRVVRSGGNIFLADYIVPSSRSYRNSLIAIIERMAGVKHFFNYRDFYKRGGVIAAAEASGLPYSLLHTFHGDTFGLVSLKNVSH